MKANEIQVGMIVKRALNVHCDRGVEANSPWHGGRVSEIHFSGRTYIGIQTQYESEYGSACGTGWSVNDEDIALGKVMIDGKLFADAELVKRTYPKAGQ